MVDLKAQKGDYRRTALAIRKSSATKNKNIAINKALNLVTNSEKAKVIAGYLSIGSEANPISFMIKRASFQKVTVPVVINSREALKFSLWTPSSKLKTADFGVSIPRVNEFLEPDIIVVPMLAFNSRGARLGYGGGFYDRTLSSLRATKKITAIGIAFSEQQIEGLPIGKNDQFVDCIVTDKNTFWL
tara:strand:+ start:1562 stop:2122 length:561 start_codon:yes stop_codon:yes gene_type:complete